MEVVILQVEPTLYEGQLHIEPQRNGASERNVSFRNSNETEVPVELIIPPPPFDKCSSSSLGTGPLLPSPVVPLGQVGDSGALGGAGWGVHCGILWSDSQGSYWLEARTVYVTLCPSPTDVRPKWKPWQGNVKCNPSLVGVLMQGRSLLLKIFLFVCLFALEIKMPL